MHLEEFPLQSAPEPEWPYSAPASAALASGAPRITSDPSQYALANATMLPPSTSTAYSVQSNSRAQPFNDVSSAPYAPTAQSRPCIPMNYPTCIESMSSHYGMQTSRHGMALQISQAPAATYSTAELSQHWTPLSSTNRPLLNNYTFDTETPPNYLSSAFTYLPSSGIAYPTGSTEVSSVFPGLSPLASSLPYNGTNRILPNPASGHSSLHSNAGSTQESDGILGSFQQHIEKTNEPWNLGGGSARGSVGSTAQDHINTSEPASSTSSSSPSDTHGASRNGYDNLAYPSHIESDASASRIISGGASRRTNNENCFDATTSGPLSNNPGRSQLLNLNSSFNMHGLRGGFGVQGEPVISTGSFVNNQLAPSIRHSQPQHSAVHDLPPTLRGSVSSKPLEPQSTSNNSNSRGFKSQRLA